MGAYIGQLFRAGVPSERSSVWRYGLAVLAVLAALGVALQIEMLFGLHAPYVPFALAIVLAARFGGQGPALTATALSTLAMVQILIRPELEIGHQAPLAGLALFVVVGSLISIFVGRLRNSLLYVSRAEEAVRQASEQRGLALEAANLGAWDYRFETGEVFWDERCRKMFGFPACSQIDYAVALSRVHPDDRAGTDEAMKQAMAGANAGVFDQEYRVIWPDDSVHWIASHGRAFFEREGDQRRTARFVGVSMDVTERRRAEEGLRQAQKLESIGFLAGGVAHDFNNLLTVIMGSASSALEEEPSCKYARTILAASERAADLTKQLLAYAGKGQVVIKVLDLSEVVSQYSGLLLASIPKRVRVEFRLAKDLPCLEADPSRIEQILMNLAINAAEAIPPRTDGLIEIATHNCDVTPDVARRHSHAYDVVPGRYVCLKVRDNGSGIDQATMSRIFDPFFSTKFTGRGMGLAAVHGIVRMARGFVEVHSSPGQGTTFQVFLPASGKTRETEEAQSTARRQHRGSSTVLVIDDEEMVRKLAILTLRRHGYDVLEAENGQRALDLLAGLSSLPSVALVDLAMPVLGGDELLPILRAKYPDLKIILTSGYPEMNARQIFPPGAIAGFLQKPYTGPVLAEVVRKAIERPELSVRRFPRDPM